MREILFKAKRKDNGEWVEGDFQQDRDLRLAYISGFSYYSSPEGLQREPFLDEIDTLTLCQYTGLTDKNGKRIWENDILSAHWDNDYPEDVSYCKVVWKENGFKTVEKESVDSEYLLKIDCDEYYEVVGNIFDNTELLGEVEDE